MKCSQVTKIVTEIKLEGVWGKLEAKEEKSFTKYLRGKFNLFLKSFC